MVLAVVVVAAVAVVLVTSGQGDELRYQVVRNLCPLVDLEPLERRAGGPATSAVPEEVSYVEHECTVDFDASFDVQVHTYIIEQDLEADYHDIWRDDLGDGTTLHEVEGVGTDAFVTSWIADSPLPPEATPGSTTPGTSMNATLYVLDSNLSLTVQMSGVVTEDDVDGTEYDEDLVRTAEDVMAGLERAR